MGSDGYQPQSCQQWSRDAVYGLGCVGTGSDRVSQRVMSNVQTMRRLTPLLWLELGVYSCLAHASMAGQRMDSHNCNLGCEKTGHIPS